MRGRLGRLVATYLLRRRLGLDAFPSALSSLPPAVLMVLSAVLCPASLRRWGARRVTAAALALGVLLLSRTTAPAGIGLASALLGAGFGTVMVAATQVIVRGAEVRTAGVAGGVRLTALNVGPAVDVAAASAPLGTGTRDALLALAAVAALAVPVARLLPGPAGAASRTPAPHAPVPAAAPERR
ncbi:hypothetical protein ACFY9A_16355 [Streptomyces rubradiris]|uniref:hypothetical protein n=1 Tax=Streptomyces rubradiris TaxID=285531 RepID=UPI0036E978D9